MASMPQFVALGSMVQAGEQDVQKGRQMQRRRDQALLPDFPGCNSAAAKTTWS